MLRQLWLFVAIFAFAALSSALSLDNIHVDGIEAYLHHGEKRQAAGTGRTSPGPSSAPASQTPPASSAPPQSQNPPPNSTPPPDNNNDPTPTPTPTPTPKPTSARTTAIVNTTPLVSVSVEQFVTVFTTVSNGQQVIETAVTFRSMTITTGQATSTDAPTSQENSSNSSGLTKSNKAIIGGVVGGVGGALLLGGIALVFLRMKRRQHRVSNEDDDLTLGTGSALGDKRSSVQGGSTPFQSNLEQYHNPGGRPKPNAAANF